MHELPQCVVSSCPQLFTSFSLQISSPADPLYFKLNKLKQTQNSHSHPASVSPQPSLQSSSNLSPSDTPTSTTCTVRSWRPNGPVACAARHACPQHYRFDPLVVLWAIRNVLCGTCKGKVISKMTLSASGRVLRISTPVWRQQGTHTSV